MKKLVFITLAVILASMIVFGSCTEPAPTTQTPTTQTPATQTPTATTPTPTPTTPTPQYGGVLKVVTNRAPVAFGVPAEHSGLDGGFVYGCLEPLVYTDSRGEPSPGLATDWEIAQDHITFYLRKGVKFHDGTDFNAEAAKWNLESVKPVYAEFKYVSSIEVIDDYTIRLNLTQYNNAFLTQLAFSAGEMISPAAVEKNGLDWAKTHPVGTGPFEFKEYKRDVHVKYERFDDYWDTGKPYLDGLEYIIIPETKTAIMALQAGDAHMITLMNSVVGARDAKDMADKGFVVKGMPGTSCFICGDSANPGSPFAKQEVREAIEYAINKKEIVDAFGFGYMEVLNQIIVPQCVGYNPDIKGRDYDPDKARQLLKDAGYADGFDTTIMGWEALTNLDIMVAVQNYLADVNIRTNIDVCDAGRWFETRKGWDNALLMSLTGVDVNVLQRLPTDLAAGGERYVSLWRPPGWQPALDEAMATMTLEEREKALQEVSKICFDNAMVASLWMGNDMLVLDKSVQDCDWMEVHKSLWKPGNAWLSE